MKGDPGSAVSGASAFDACRLPLLFIIYFAALGLLVPYLPKYLKDLGFSGPQMSYIAALGPLGTILATPVWGFIADRTGNLPRVLRWVTLGAVLTFAPVLWLNSFFLVAICMGVYSSFVTSVSPLIDALAVADAKRRGTEYARTRLFGSIGFIATTLLFGFALHYGATPWHALPAALFFLGATTVLAFSVQSDATLQRGPPPTLKDSLRLASRPEVFLFLLAGLVHWGTMATYYLCFAIHMEDLKEPSYFTGIAIGAGVVTEILAMWYYRSIRKRFPILVLMLIGQFSTVARWLATGQVESGIALALLQAMHGLSFGMYFPACIDYLERVAPPELRSTARALFASVAFGIGGVLGNVLAGEMYQLGGGRMAFMVAGGVEFAAPLLMLAAWYFVPREAAQESPAPRAS